MEHKHPERWHQKLASLETTKLAPDEILSMIIYFEINDSRVKEGNKIHNIFTIVKKGEKSIARMILVEGENQKVNVCEVAQYPIEQEAEMVNELKQDAIELAQTLTMELEKKEKGTLQKSVFCLVIPEARTNEDVAKIIDEDITETSNIPREMIKSLLGLPGQKKEIIVPKIQEKKTKITKKKEEELIKKFGLKNMEKLAKQLNFHGKILNKIK